MANYFLLRDGLLGDTGTYGISMSGAEKLNNSTGYKLTTNDSWSTQLSGASSNIIDSIAIHLSGRSANPTGTLTLQISSRTFSPTTLGTYPISSFTSYYGVNDQMSNYPLNWQLLKLSTPFTNTNTFFRVNLKTSNSDQLSLMALSTVNGISYDLMCIRDTYVASPPNILHIGSKLDGYSTENRTITASTGTYNDIYIHKNGSLVFPTSSTTLSVIGTSGIQITSEGTLQIGSSSSPVADTTTHQILLSSTIGVNNYSVLNTYGAYKLPYATFSEDYAAGTNVFITLESLSTTWKANDNVVLLPNTTTNNTIDTSTVNSFLTEKRVVTNSSTSFAHPVVSYLPNIANLTRNVKIGGFSSIAKGTIKSLNNSNVNLNNTEFLCIRGSLASDNSSYVSLSGCTLSGFGGETLHSSTNTNSTEFSGSRLVGPIGVTDFDINPGTDFTIEMYVKTYTVAGTIQDIFYYGTASPLANSDYGILTRIQGNKFTAAFYVGAAATAVLTANAINENTWHHVAIVASNSALKLYIDGTSLDQSTQVNYNYNNTTFRPIIGGNLGGNLWLQGKISNLRFVRGKAVYTSNFTPPTSALGLITESGVTNLVLACQSPDFVDTGDLKLPLSGYNINNIKFDADSVFGSQYKNCNINNCVTFKTKYGITLNNGISSNNTINNNLILSSMYSGIYINNGGMGSISSSNNNISVGPSTYGTYLENNANNKTLNGIINYDNTYGTYIKTAHSGVISNITNTYNTSGGVYVDGNTQNLSSTIFRNITASNNKTVGFIVSGNSINHLSPVILNIDGLVANSNLNGGFEGYCIAGNLSSIQLSGNSGNYAMKTSIGNYYTTIDGITALTNDVVGTSAAIGILSAINYYPTVIKNSKVGKAVGSSVYGAAISLDSTKFSQFNVYNSTVSGGSSDFQLRNTNGVIEGSYLIGNTNIGNLPVGAGVTSSNYQSDVLKTTGFAFTNMNNASGYNVTYLAAGTRQIDSTTTCNINESTSPSERLTPQSTTLKLRSGSKFVALNAGESTAINVYVRKSTLATNGAAYNGNSPRLMLKRNGAMGINSDIVMDQLDTTSENFLKLGGVSPAVTDSGVLEFYVDCDGTQGWINIDNWTAN